MTTQHKRYFMVLCEDHSTRNELQFNMNLPKGADFIGVIQLEPEVAEIFQTAIKNEQTMIAIKQMIDNSKPLTRMVEVAKQARGKCLSK